MSCRENFPSVFLFLMPIWGEKYMQFLYFEENIQVPQVIPGMCQGICMRKGSKS